MTSTTLDSKARPIPQYRLFALALRHVQHYGGAIQHLTEAGFVALFGLSLTHEGHALRALLAATALRRSLHEAGAEHGREGETERAILPLPVCLGVHTGPVWVWRNRCNPGQVSAIMGDTMYLADQLACHAVPNTLLISEATAQRVQGYAVLRVGEAMGLAAEATPVQVYRVVGMRSPRDPTVRPSEHVLSQFVGRGTNWPGSRGC